MCASCSLELASVGADQGFAAERVWDDSAERRLVASIAPQPTMLPRERRGPRTNAQRRALAARARANSDAGVWAYRRRMADAEGVIAELKNQHGLDRVRCRGAPAFDVQLLLGCAAINLKRLAKHVPTAQQGNAAAPAAAAAEPGTASDQPPHDRPRVTIRLGRGQLLWNTRPCLN